MAKLIAAPAIVQAAGNKPKIIKEFVGRVASGTREVGVEHMTCRRRGGELRDDPVALFEQLIERHSTARRLHLQLVKGGDGRPILHRNERT